MVVQHQTDNTGPIRRSQAADKHNERNRHGFTICRVEIYSHGHDNTRTNHAAYEGDITNHNHIKIANKIHQYPKAHRNDQPATYIIEESVR